MIERTKNGEKDVEALLPWYEKGTLPTDEAGLVEDYLKSHPSEGGRFIELIREEVNETIEANESAGMPPAAALNRLMDAIAAEPKRSGVAVRARAGGFLSKLFGEGAASWMPAATAVACLVIVLQATALGVLITNPMGVEDPTGPRIRSVGPEAISENGQRIVLIRFNPDASAKDITALLNALEATIVEGPRLGGVYRVRISNQPMRAEQIEAIMKQMRERPDILTVLPSQG